MKNLEQAHRTLDLKPGATLKEVIEAREDLLALWDLDRLSDHPRLRSKATEKIREINEAYEVLIERLGRTGLQKSSKAPGPSTVVLPHDRPSGRPSVSLFDEFFSEEMSKGSRQIPVWSIVTLVTIAVLAMGYLLRSTEPEKSEQSPEMPAVAEPLPSVLPAATQEGVVSAHLDTKLEGDEAENEPGTVPEKSTETGTGTAAQKLGSPLVEAVSARSNSTGFAPTTQPAPSAEKKAGKGASPRRDHSERKAPAKPRPPGQRPLLVRDEAPSPGESAGADIQKESSPEEKESHPEEVEKSYRSLLANSSVAHTLVEGGFETLRFAEWKVVQQEASEIWIDLIANQSNGGTVHFIWSVNVEDGTTRPMSEAARNLERGGPPTKSF